jgi:hypothetical protein
MGMAFDFKVGDRVHWTDPDEDNPCSGDGVIVHIQGAGEFPVDDETIISLKMDDEGECEVLPHEIKKI